MMTTKELCDAFNKYAAADPTALRLLFDRPVTGNRALVEIPNITTCERGGKHLVTALDVIGAALLSAGESYIAWDHAAQRFAPMTPPEPLKDPNMIEDNMGTTS